MSCDEYEYEIALLGDDGAVPDAELERHLEGCPECAAKLSGFAELRSLMSSTPTPVATPELTAAVRRAVIDELTEAETRNRLGSLTASFRNWMLPLASGVTAAILVGSAMIYFLLAGPGATEEAKIYGPPESEGEVVFLDPSENPGPPSPITAEQLSSERASVSAVSPTVNPKGPVSAVTAALTSGRIRGNELVIVASILSDGMVDVESYVAPLDDPDAIFELERALSDRSGEAPFVPAFLDKRPPETRIVLRFQRVDVRIR